MPASSNVSLWLNWASGAEAHSVSWLPFRRSRAEGAWCGGKAAWVGEAEVGIPRNALGEGGGEDWGLHIVVVVDFSGALAGIGAQDPADVLDEAALECDRRGQEQGVEGWAVEALADVWAGGDHQQRRPVRVGLQAGEGGCACFGAHATPQDHRVMAAIAQSAGELVEVAGPLGQHQAMPATGERLSDISRHLGGPGLVGAQVSIDGCDSARGGRVGFTGVGELREVHPEHGDWTLRRLT